MYNLLSVLILLLCSMLYSSVEAANALGPCAGGRGVPVEPTASGGACGFPAITGILTANVDQAFFNGGVKCGECYQVTGPLGVVTVMVNDMCSSVAPKCGGDRDNFGIATSAFQMIANATTDIIYDLGYRRVTCDVTGNVQMLVGTDSSAYYFSLIAYNFRVGVSGVGVKSDSWSAFETLTRGTNSGRWAWNKNQNVLSFPLTISIVGETGEVLQFKTSSWTAGSTIDFGAQFADVAPGNGLCPLAEPPVYIYEDSVTYGWDVSNSFGYNSAPNVAYTTDSVSGTSIFADLSPYGGLQFTRNGGFNPSYFNTLQFSMRAYSQGVIRVYLGSLAPGQSGGVTISNITPNEWQVFNVSLVELGATTVEFDVVFQNFQSNAAQYVFDNIRFIVASTSPLDNVTYSNTPVGTTAMSTSTTGASSGNTGQSVGVSGLATTSLNFDTTSTGQGSTTSTSSASTITFSCVFCLLGLIASLAVHV